MNANIIVQYLSIYLAGLNILSIMKHVGCYTFLPSLHNQILKALRIQDGETLKKGRIWYLSTSFSIHINPVHGGNLSFFFVGVSVVLLEN